MLRIFNFVKLLILLCCIWLSGVGVFLVVVVCEYQLPAEIICFVCVYRLWSMNLYTHRREQLSRELISTYDGRVRPRHRPHRKHHFQHFLYCCVLICCCVNVFTVPLPSNGRLYLSDHSGFQPCHNIYLKVQLYHILPISLPLYITIIQNTCFCVGWD
jgi:hypothetical protein